LDLNEYNDEMVHGIGGERPFQHSVTQVTQHRIRRSEQAATKALLTERRCMYETAPTNYFATVNVSTARPITPDTIKTKIN